MRTGLTLGILILLLAGCMPATSEAPLPKVRYEIVVETTTWPIARACYYADNYAMTSSRILVVFSPYWLGCNKPTPVPTETIGTSGLTASHLYLSVFLAGDDRVSVIDRGARDD